MRGTGGKQESEFQGHGAQAARGGRVMRALFLFATSIQDPLVLTLPSCLTLLSASRTWICSASAATFSSSWK